MVTKILIGNIIDSPAQTLINTVNCVGVMGKGIALEFKKQFPDMYKDYEMRCQRGDVKLGEPYLYKSLLPPWILNFPTKDHWRSISNWDDIREGLEYLQNKYERWGITSLAVPPLGMGSGKLEWIKIGPFIYRYLNRLDIPVELYAPYGTPQEQLQIEFLEQEIQIEKSMMITEEHLPAFIAVIEILRRIYSNRYHHHHSIGRTKLQKIAYIATVIGLVTGLQFQKRSYGPYSAELNNKLTSLVNSGLLIEQKRIRGYRFVYKIGSQFEESKMKYQAQLTEWDPIIEKTVDLFMRLDTRQSEIVATIIYSYHDLPRNNKNKPSELDVLNYVKGWKIRRRPPLDESEIADNIRNLAILGWLNVEYSPELPVSYDFDEF
ncbi:MAG: macro domain-containing protein [candidate division Zixibacteria bacterium]|nr:macro domain-containing protein [Candidatus Tariuqbacter arcticus]